MGKMTLYKIVHKRGRVYESAVVWDYMYWSDPGRMGSAEAEMHRKHLLRKQYSRIFSTRPNKVALQRGYGLCLFEHLWQAEHFLQCNAVYPGGVDLHVFVADAWGAWKPFGEKIVWPICWHDLEKWEQFNHSVDAKTFSNWNRGFPDGTWMAERVKLRKEIAGWEPTSRKLVFKNLEDENAYSRSQTVA